MKTLDLHPPSNNLAYATRTDYATLQRDLIKDLLELGIYQKSDPAILKKQVEYKKEAGRLPLVRISNITNEQLIDVLTARGFELVPVLTDLQKVSSGQFTILSFKHDSKLYTFVMRGIKTAFGAGKDGIVLNRKDLTPVKLGLGQEYKRKTELVAATKEALNNKIKNPVLLSALQELVDIANAGGKGRVTPETIEKIKPYLIMISQDFGEVLVPILLAKANDRIQFPLGNEKLIDVTVGKKRISVKAASGSGTSMNSLGTLLDEYEESIVDKNRKAMFNNAIKVWKSTKEEGSVLDRICLAANLNKTPEYRSYVNLLGGEFKNFDELTKLLKPKIKKLDYTKFLKLVKPAMESGNWKQKKGTTIMAVGMPDDGEYYLGQSTKIPKGGVAGKRSYDHDSVNGAANIITYSLGKGIEYMITRGPNSDLYEDIMTDMVKQLNCWLGHVTVDAEGGLTINTKPFSQLKFKFDYHAPSHKAGNNRPGFVIVRD